MKTFWKFLLFILATLALIFIVIEVSLWLKKGQSPIIQETVIIEQKIPVFRFITYEYTIHTVEKIINPGKDIFIGLVHSGDVTLLFEYFAQVQIVVDREDIEKATVEPGHIILTDDIFKIQIVNPKFEYLGQLSSNSFTINSIPTNVIFDSLKISDRLKEIVINDGGMTAAKKSFCEQYRQLFENYDIEVNIEIK